MRTGGKHRISLAGRIRYFVNNLLIRNPLWQILSLIVISAMIICLGMVLVGDIYPEGSFWWSFTRLLDQGTFIEDYEYQPQVTTVGVMVTIGGIMVLSLLIGIFSSKITEQLDSLKRGKSQVLENKHYIVCGYGDRLYEVTRELLKAHDEDSINGKIVIFSESTREEVEEVLVQRLPRKSLKKVICRSGDTTDVDSLQLPCFQRCAGFVLVGDDDARIVKTLVAVNALKGDDHPTGVCELRDRTKHRIARMAYRDIHWLPVREIVMRLIVQVCRQPGLSTVYSEILSFQGNEFYIKDHPETRGLRFREASRRIMGGVLVGISRSGKMLINPASDTELAEGDELLVLAESFNSYSFSGKEADESDYAFAQKETCRKPISMLVFSGSSRKFSFMLGLLDAYAMEGAAILVAGSLPVEEGRELMSNMDMKNCSLEYTQTDRTDPDCMIALHPENYDSIMVISGKSPGMTDEDADSQCIVSLLILKHIADDLGDSWQSTVVSEIRNPRNRRLASAAGIDDFVISNEVCSMIMAQLVLEPKLGKVYEEIFDPAGCEIQLRCPSNYESRQFHALSAEGLCHGEIVLGWLTGTGIEAEVTLNPGKYDELPSDESTKIVVIAER